MGVLINTGQMYSILKGFSVKLAEHQKPAGIRNLPQDNLVLPRNSKIAGHW